MEYRPREINQKLEHELETREATVITGLRQCGKTTILNHLFAKVASPNKVLLDLEDPLNRKIFETESFESVWQNLAQFGVNNRERAYIFLDEIQNLPVISKVVKYFIDHWQVKFFLTGSSSYYLKNLFPESMAGRKLIFELFPLTFKEFLTFKGVKRTTGSELSYANMAPYYDEFMEYGGLPAVVLESNFERKKSLLREIFTSYFDKDVKSLGDFNELGKIRDLILLLIPRVGGQVDVASLASELGTSRETVYSYLTFLEKTYFINLIPKHSGSLRRQSAGSKKIYLADVGLANMLGRLSSGQILEQAVYQSLRPSNEITYFRVKNTEIDFILNKKIALEVKENGDNHDVARLNRMVDKLKLTGGTVISKKFKSGDGFKLALDL